MTHSWRNISWCSRMLLSGVSGPLFGIWHRVVGGQAIRSPRRSEIQECCNLGSEMCRASDLSVGTDMFACFCHGKCTYVEAERGESPPGSTQHHIIKLFFFFTHFKGRTSPTFPHGRGTWNCFSAGMVDIFGVGKIFWWGWKQQKLFSLRSTGLLWLFWRETLGSVTR